jgi:carboxyl-terminal processing protease
MIRNVVWGWLVVVFLGIAAPVRAVEEPVQPYVVLVGINKYADKQILPRTSAEADAQALYDVLTSKDYLGVDAKHVRLLLGSEDEKRGAEIATRANVLKALTWLSKSAGKNDLAIFAYFGQGAPLGERAVYFTTDSTFKNRAKDAVASGDIENELDTLKSQKFVAFLDVNFLGFNVGKQDKPDPDLRNFYREFYGKEDAKGISPSRVVFLPNSGIKPSLTSGKNGLLAEVLVNALKGKADREGYEPDGVITIGELVKYVKREMPNRARTLGKTDDEKGQTPVIFDFQSNDFIVTHNPAVYPQARERVGKFEKLARERKLAPEIVEEGVGFLSRMPKLETQQRLRKAYQKLAEGEMSQAAFKEERDAVQSLIMLPDREAEAYALTIMKAVGSVRRNFVKDTNAGQLVESAITGLYHYLDAPIPSALKERLADAKTMRDADLLKLLTEARQHLGKREDLTGGKDITHSLHPMLGKLDKHTDYIDPDTMQRLQTDITGHFTGIGVQIKKNNIRDMLQVVTPIKDSPAYRAGMQANDFISTIVREVDSEGRPLEKPETLSTKGMTTEDAVKKILGREGTKVKLIIERDGKELEFNLIRGKVEVESVVGVQRNADDSWNYVVDPENKICYVRLTTFSHNTYRDLERVMSRLSKAGIKGFILDLRFNPGGLLDQAVKITDLFIDDGMIVTIRPRNGPESSYIGQGGGYLVFPMVCLVNGGSASASEIVSAALQDHGRAMIVGSRSYGKGSVQTIHPFETGGRLKLTTALFFSPLKRNLNRASTNGKDEDEWGVKPDVGFDLQLPIKELNDLQDWQKDREIIRRPGQRAETRPEFHDRQLDLALEYLRSRIRTVKNGTDKKAS